MKIPLITGWICLLVFPLWAQPTDLRVEVEVESYADAFYVMATGEDGLVLFGEADTSSKLSDKIWEFTKFTNEFVQIWQRQITVHFRQIYERHYWDGQSLHVLLMDEKVRRKRPFVIISLNAETGELTKNEGVVPFNMTVNDFNVIKNYAYIGGETRQGKIEAYGRSVAAAFVVPIIGTGLLEYRSKMVLNRVNLDNEKNKNLNIEYKQQSTVQSLETNPQARSMAALIMHSPKPKYNRIYLKEYAGEKLIRNLEVNPKSDNKLKTARVIYLNRNEFLVVGEYGPPHYREGFWKKFGSFITQTRIESASQGIYIAKFSYRGQKFIRYYPFTEFENFFKAYGVKKEKKIKKKAKRKKKKNKELLISKMLDFDLLLHDIIEFDDQYLFVAESYKEEYQPANYGNPYSPIGGGLGGGFGLGLGFGGGGGNRQVFAGYRYTHAIVAGIDQESGRLQWDNSFPIWNILSFNLKERVQVLPQEADTTVRMVYNYGGALLSKTVKEGEVIGSRQIKAVRTEFATDRVLENYRSDIEYWYDNYFLAWGYQRITDRSQGFFSNKRRRIVFYFYKVGY